MKIFIMSDVHGSAYWCERALQREEVEQCDKILLLGDLLYHGPRNALPRDYNPTKVIEMLNARKERILCVRGNCEAEVDQMVLSFPVMVEYIAVLTPEATLYATHGHKYNKQTPLPISQGVVLYGHTHVPDSEQIEGVLYLNPGSVSLPKGGSENSYMVFDGAKFIWKNMDGDVLQERAL